MTEVVQRQFQLERKDEFMRAFIKDAIVNVVKPLQMKVELVDDNELAIVPEQPLPPRANWAGQEIEQQKPPIDDWQR
jgi:uncharacterized protein